MFQLKNTPFHERTSSLCQPQNWRKWAGYYVVGSYEHTIDREYWAIRNVAALLHKVTTRNIYRMKVGQGRMWSRYSSNKNFRSIATSEVFILLICHS